MTKWKLHSHQNILNNKPFRFKPTWLFLFVVPVILKISSCLHCSCLNVVFHFERQSKVLPTSRCPCFVTDVFLNLQFTQHITTSQWSAPITPHSAGAYDMRGIHLLTGDKSLSFKKEWQGLSEALLHRVHYWQPLQCWGHVGVGGGTSPQCTAGSACSFMWIWMRYFLQPILNELKGRRKMFLNGNFEPQKQNGHRLRLNTTSPSNPRNWNTTFPASENWFKA